MVKYELARKIYSIINGVHLTETQDVNEELNSYFEDGKHLDDVGNIADENAIWVYFGVGGPA